MIFVAATLAAVIERWLFSAAWNDSGSLTSPFYYGDAQRLVEYAVAIVQHQTFDNGIPFHPPGWPLALAGFFKLLGLESAGNPVVPVAAVKWLLAAISGLTVGVSTLVAYEVGGPVAMIVVALVGPFHFGHIVEGTVADTEALYGLCVALSMFVMLRWIARSGRSSLLWATAAGVICGYGTVTRAEFLAATIILLGCVIWQRRDNIARPGGRITRLAVMLFAAGYALPLLPTTVWHWRSLAAFNQSHAGRLPGAIPELAPVTSYGPFNFAMANHENADGGPNRDHPMLDRCNEESTGRLNVGQLDLECPAVFDLYVHGYRIGTAWMATHPSDALALVGRKLEMASGFLAHGYLADDVGAGVDGIRRRVDLVDPASRSLFWIHLGLACIGVAVLWRGWKNAGGVRKAARCGLPVVLAPVAAFLASTVLFYGYVRLGTAYLPAVWVLQGAAIAAIVGRSGQVKARTAAIVIATIALLLGIEGARTDRPRPLVIDGPRNEAGAIIQDETVSIRRGREDFLRP